MSTTGKNVWQKFVDSVLEAIKKKFGNKPNGTVLNTAMDLITAEIGLDYADTATETTEETAEEEVTEETAQAQPKTGTRKGFNDVEEVVFSNPNIKLEGFEIDGNYWNVITSFDRAKVLVNINGTIVPFYLTSGKGGKDLIPGWYPFFGIGNDGWINKTNKSDMEVYYENYWGKEAADIVRSISQELNKFYGTDPAAFKADKDPNEASRPISSLAEKAEDYINSKISFTPAINDGKAKESIKANIKQLGAEITTAYAAEAEEEVEIIDAVSTDQTPASLYDKYPDFMDTMVVMYKEQSRARVENNEDPLGIFEKKNGEELTNKELVETTGFKTWWKQKFNRNKNAAIDTFNATYTIGTLSGDSLFTDAEVNNAKSSGAISRAKLIKLADKIASQQELSEQEQSMSAIPAIQNALATLQEQREKDRKELSSKSIIDTPMKNALRALGFTDVAISKMSISEAQKLITNGVPLSELKEQQAQEEKKVKTKQNKKRDIARKTVIDKFENSQTIDELEQQYDQFTALIAANVNGIADALELQTFSLDELKQQNIDRIASELNFDDLYVGNAVLLQDGNIAVVDSVNKDTGVIILEYIKSDRGVTITRDNLTKFVKARFSEAYKLSTESKKGKPVTEEEAKTHKQSTEIAKSETEQIEEANKEALSKTDEERTNSFLDSTIKRCK